MDAVAAVGPVSGRKISRIRLDDMVFSGEQYISNPEITTGYLEEMQTEKEKGWAEQQRHARTRVRRRFVERSHISVLRQRTSGKPVPSRYDYDGPAWYERKRSGYKGVAWYDLPAVNVCKTRSQEQTKGNSQVTGLPKKFRFSSLNYERSLTEQQGRPVWMNLNEREAAAGLMYERALREFSTSELAGSSVDSDTLAREPALQETSSSGDLQGERALCELSTSELASSSVDSDRLAREPALQETNSSDDLQGDKEQEEKLIENKCVEHVRLEHMRTIAAEKRQCLRNEQRLKNCLVHQRDVDNVFAITEDAHHFPLMMAMLRAKAAVEYGQGSAIVRNWLLIKNAFDRGGGVLSLQNLRKTLIACGITLPQVTRVVFKATQTMAAGEDLVAHDDIYSQYFDVKTKPKTVMSEGENTKLEGREETARDEYEFESDDSDDDGGYKTDSDLEDLLSICMEAGQQDQLVHECEERIFDSQDKAVADDIETMEGHKDDRRSEHIETKKPKLFVTLGKPHVAMSSFWDDDVGVVDEGKYRRRVLRLKRKIKAAMRTRDAAVVEKDEPSFSVDEILDLAGNSLSFLKLINKKWVQKQTLCKSSALINSAVHQLVPQPILTSPCLTALGRYGSGCNNNNNPTPRSNLTSRSAVNHACSDSIILHAAARNPLDLDDKSDSKRVAYLNLFSVIRYSPGFEVLLKTKDSKMALVAQAIVARHGNERALHLLGSQPSLGQCVLVINEVAAVMCQAIIRGFHTRNRARQFFQEAIVTRMNHKRKRKLVLQWFRVSFTQQQARKLLLRPFVTWNIYLQRMKRMREFFRIAFWPFFVWRRSANRKVRARNKARFLKRVWNAYTQLHHLRAWHLFVENSHARMRRAMNRFQMSAGRQLAVVFREWRGVAVATRRLQMLWDQSDGGAKLAERITRRWLVRTWVCWRLSVMGDRLLRVRSLKLYNFVRHEIVEMHRANRERLQLPVRRYSLATLSSLPDFPSVEDILGSACVKLLQESGQAPMYGLCKSYHADQLIPKDRLGRILTCIRRNVCGPMIFKDWRRLVEDAQKERYAWYHCSTRIVRQVFKAWSTVHTKHIQQQASQVTTCAKNFSAKRNSTKPFPVHEPPKPADELKREYCNTRNRLLLLGSSSHSPDRVGFATGNRHEAGAADKLASGESVIDEEVKIQHRATLALKMRRKSLAIFQAERAESHEQWIQDPSFECEKILEVTNTIMTLRKANLTRQIQLEVHKKRLKLAQDNAAMSLCATERLLEVKAKPLEEEKRKYAEYASNLHRQRGRILHDVLNEVINEVNKERVTKLQWQCFRMIKFPVIYKRSFGLLQRKRLQSWLGICVRLRNIWRAMPKFRNLRIEWQIFNKWLQFMDRRYQHESEGLREELALRTKRMRAYSDYIKEAGEDGAEGTPKAWFRRWMEFVQKKHARSCLVSLAKKRNDYLLLQRVLELWRGSLKPRYTWEARREQLPFAVRRVYYDLNKWKCRLLGQEKRLLSTRLRKRNAFINDRTMFTVRGPGYAKEVRLLKKVLEKHTLTVRARLDLETRLLCSAFEERGTFPFNSKCVEKRVGSVGVDEEADISRHFVDPVVATSITMHSILVAVSEEMVVGLQRKIRSGSVSAPHISNSKPCGCKGGTKDFSDGGYDELKHGPGFEVFEFKMQGADEKIVAIEGFALKEVTCKVRFRTTLGRVSPWYGNGEGGTKFILRPGQEMSAKGNGYRFVEEFIIDMCDVDSETSIPSSGTLLPQVDQTNVFSHCWLDRFKSPLNNNLDSEDIAEKHSFMELQKFEHQNQFNSVLAMRSADVEEALARSIRLARHMRYSPCISPQLCKPRVVEGIMRWFFNAQSKHLVKMSAAAVDNFQKSADGDRTITKGYMMIHQGNVMLKEAQVQIKRVCALTERKDALSQLNEAHIGTKRFEQIAANMTVAQNQLKAAEQFITDGRTIVDEGLFDTPKLNMSAASVKYYEDLVWLATIKDQMS